MFRNSVADRHPRRATELRRTAAARRGRPVRSRRLRVRQGLREPANVHRHGLVRARARAWPRGVGQLHPRADRSPDPLLQRATTRCSELPWARAWPAAQRYRQPDSSSRAPPSRATTASRPSSGGRSSQHLQFQVNYTLSFDKSDDDNERDPVHLPVRPGRFAPGRVRLQRPRPAPPVQRLAAGRAAWRHLPQQPRQRVLGAAGLGEVRRQQPGHRSSVASLGRRRSRGSAPTATSSSGTRSARTTRSSRGTSGVEAVQSRSAGHLRGRSSRCST